MLIIHIKPIKKTPPLLYIALPTRELKARFHKCYSSHVVGGATLNEGELVAWPFFYKLSEHFATPTAVKK